ncbi:other/SCY1 protein kinase [Rhodotorula toruloides]|uniref:Other/SCY1 protein kinase n=1 Tax=Rhodotorula toruloides TaxID=5286 RepID=A0A511KGK6_RHOTO|nr:other/SCY1 protein kinase [Rhodotorula toruloides]
MNFLSSISSSLISAGSAALANASGGVPGVQGYQLGDKVLAYEGKSIWTQWSGTKKDDSSPVSVFSFDLSTPSHISSHDRRSLFPLARNAFRKLRALRHPNILKFLDGSETDNAIWVVTEPVRSLALELEGHGGLSEESKIYGLLHVCTALGFLNRDGQSVHGGLRATSVWATPGGEWKLGGMEVCSRLDEPDGAMWHVGGLLPDSRTHAPPEVRRGGWTALKEYDVSTLDSYLLHLFLYTVFNGPLPTSYLSPSASETPSLPQVRGSIPPALFQPWRRLGNPNPAARLKTSAFLDLGNHPGEGWWTSNRLVKLSTALEGFSLGTEDERVGLIRTLKAISAGAANAKTAPLPSGFLKYKVLPSLVHTLEFSSGSGGAPLLPVILDLSTSDGSTNLDEKEYQRDVIQPLVRMYAMPDRAIRMALLENLERYADKLQNKDVNERVWPHLQTGFGDVVPVIREATVKAIPLIAPKLNDRILNNDLLRVLSKTQTDVEPGIRTNTCILLSRLSRHIQTSTQRKVLIPAFARALRDPFVHARIAGLMALMATCEVFEKEDLAGKVIPAMSICLVDREKIVRDQAFKAIDMFVKKCETLTASMPETVLPETAQQSPALQAASQTQPGLATNAAGAAGALAGWAFASVSKKLSSAEMAAPIERRDSSQSVSSASTSAANGVTVPAYRTSTDSTSASPQVPGGFGGVAKGTEDWGGDLMDVNDDDADWDEFESGQPVPARIVAARLPSSKHKPARGRGGSLRLGAASRSSGLRIPLDMDASDSWELDGSGEVPRAAAVPSNQRPIVRKPLISATSPALLAMASTYTAPSSTPASLKVVSPPFATALPSDADSKTSSFASPPLSPASTHTAFATPTSPPRAPASPVTSAPAAATPSRPSLVSLPRSPLPPSATPPPAPIPPASSTVPPVAAPVSPVPPPSDPPSRSSTPVNPASGTAGLSKEEKAARLAQAREERKARMAAAKGGVKR